MSEEHFGGLRERVLARDEWHCRVCSSIDQLLVHHRRPGANAMALLITLCRACHLRVHHTRRPAYGFDALLRLLWREMHPGLAEQLKFRLQLPPVIPDPPTIQTALFEAV